MTLQMQRPNHWAKPPSLMSLLRGLIRLITGLSVSFVTGQSDLLKLRFYYTHLKTALKMSNIGGFLLTKTSFWKIKINLFLSNNKELVHA